MGALGGTAFQACHRGPDGRPLVVDGDIGPATRWAQAFAQAPAERRAIVERAWLHVGLTESPANDDLGGVIRAWLRHAGIVVPASYCAAAASCWLGLAVGVPGAQALGRSLEATDGPALGDLMWFPTGSWQGHCGVVLGVSGDEVMTIEANVQDGVRLVRRLRADLRFGRAPGCPVAGVVPGVWPGARRVTTRAGTR